MKYLISLLILLNVSFVYADNRPDWIDNPGDGAVGSAPFHVRGVHAQEELAMTRARARLAARYGVEISSEQHITERVTDETSSVTSKRDIDEVMKKTTIKAKVKAKWHDKTRDIIYVWMVPVH